MADFALRCPLLDRADDESFVRYPHLNDVSEDCRQALDARFWGAPVAKALFPLERPLTWSDVFNDVPARFETVAAAVEDPECQVHAHDLRPDLAERCAARDMTELAVLGDMCGDLVGEFDDLTHFADLDSEVYLSALSASSRRQAIGNLDSGQRYTGNIVYGRMPSQAHEALNARLVDQAEYWRTRERIDDDYFRTAWARTRCEAERDTLSTMLARKEKWGDLMLRAAGLGDEFALTHRQLSRGRALKLIDSNLALAWVHLAKLDSAAVDAEQRRVDRLAREQLMANPPHIENRLRTLEMAGIKCPPPCTPERLLETEKRFKGEMLAFLARASDACWLEDDCDTKNALIELGEPLAQALDSDEARHGRTQRRRVYGKRAESIRMHYTFAVEALSAAHGVPVRTESLRRALADPKAPWHLDGTEIEHLRDEAERLVARVLAQEN